MPQCHQCGKQTLATIRSLYGNQRLCPACSEAERKRPIYRKVAAAGGPEPRDPSLPGLAGPGKDGINFYR